MKNQKYYYSMGMSKCVGIIWVYNPSIKEFSKVLESLVQNDIERIIIVDNGSKNRSEIIALLSNFERRLVSEFIEIGYNSGVHALNVGISRAIEIGAKWVLLLDDDTVLSPSVVKEALSKYDELCLKNRVICEKIAVINLHSSRKLSKYIHRFIPFYIAGQFSGSLVRLDVVEKNNVRIREEFFLDQADFDFFNRLRAHGYYTVYFVKKDAIWHRMGKAMKWVKCPMIKPSGVWIYENPFRFYLIVRNSTVLLTEERLQPSFYIWQIINYLIILMLIDGVLLTLRTVILGLSHGLFKRLGYIDPSIIRSKYTPRNKEALKRIMKDKR